MRELATSILPHSLRWTSGQAARRQGADIPKILHLFSHKRLDVGVLAKRFELTLKMACGSASTSKKAARLGSYLYSQHLQCTMYDVALVFHSPPLA